MTPRRQINKAVSQLMLSVVSIALFITILPVSIETASAQELIRRRNLLDRLFGGPPKQEELAPPTQQRRVAPVRKQQPSRATAKPSQRQNARPSVKAAPSVKSVEKLDNAKIVLMVGDFLAGGTAEGLTSAYASTANVRISDHNKGASGLVRNDYYDWNATLKPLLDEVKPAVVVVIVGSNDRQNIAFDGKTYQLHTEAWLTEYTNRVTTLANTLQGSKIPFIWVGLPPFRPGSMSSDMITLNDIIETATKSANGTFIDIWEGFVNEDGTFSATGPDINGNIVQLRANDGINFTREGKRKLAFYLEKTLSQIVGAPVDADSLKANNLAVLNTVDVPTIDLSTLDRTAPVSLSAPQLGNATELSGAGPRDQNLPSKKLSDPQPGRADYFLQK